MSADLHLALRAHALAVVVCTTGLTTLAATTTGYTRAAGSFVTDGFMIGMEVTPTGFTETTPGVITYVSATDMYISGGRTAQSAGANRSLAVNMPSIRLFENAEPMENGVVLPDRVVGRWWWREEFAPSSQRLTTNSPHGVTESTGLYLITLGAVAGCDSIAIRRCCDAVVDAFPPTLGFTLPDGRKARIRGEVAPWAGQATNRGAWAASLITIPWQISARLSS